MGNQFPKMWSLFIMYMSKRELEQILYVERSRNFPDFQSYC